MQNRSNAFVTLAAIALAGCGSGGGDSGSSVAAGDTATARAERTKVDPCSLVTANEVAEAIGEEVVASKAGEGSCTYETADAQASSVTIELNQADAAGEMDAARRASGVLKDLGAKPGTEGGAAGQDLNAMLSESGGIPKIGDEAFFDSNSQLNVRKGFTYLKVAPPIMRSRMSGGNPMLSAEERQEMARKIADRALSRIH